MENRRFLGKIKTLHLANMILKLDSELYKKCIRNYSIQKYTQHLVFMFHKCELLCVLLNNTMFLQEASVETIKKKLLRKL